MAIYQLDEDIPQIAASAWIADSAEVMGRVHVGERSSVWFNTVIRADNEIIDRKSTRLNSSHVSESRMPSSA